MKLIDLLLVYKMEWLYRLRELEDQSAGIYVKARASVETREKTCRWLQQGDFVCEFDQDELDPRYVKELADTNLVKIKRFGGKLLLYLGEANRYYTDPKVEGKGSDLLKVYLDHCRTYDIPAGQNVVMEVKTFSMLKTIRGKAQHLDIMAYCFANWKWLKKELSVSLPTLNVLASGYYWKRIENHFRNQPDVQNLGSRYTPEQTEEFDNWVPPR